MFRYVLLPLDGSPGSEAAMDWVARLRSAWPAKVLLLRVVPVLDANMAAQAVFAPGIPPIGTAAMADEAKAAAQYLEEQRRHLGGGQDVQCRVVNGDPGAEIVAAVKRHGMDLVVMPSHSRTGIARMVLGSVTDHVVRQAGVPVLVFAPKAAAAHGAQAEPQPAAADRTA